jgi:hypothetical protein
LLSVVALCAAVVFEDWQRIALSIVVAVVLITLAVYG